MQGYITKTVRCLNAQAAGSTNITSAAAVDMQGWDGVKFICGVGTLTANQVTALEALGSPDNASDFVAFTTDAVTPACADGDSNKLMELDIFRPMQRYVQPIVKRGTANAVIDFVIAILYKGDKSPVTADASVSATAHAFFVSP